MGDAPSSLDIPETQENLVPVGPMTHPTRNRVINVTGRRLQGQVINGQFVLNSQIAAKNLKMKPLNFMPDYSGLVTEDAVAEICDIGTRGPFSNWCLLCCIMNDRYIPHRDIRA